MSTINVELTAEEINTIVSMVEGEAKMRAEFAKEMIRDKHSKIEDIEGMMKSREILIGVVKKLKGYYDKHK